MRFVLLQAVATVALACTSTSTPSGSPDDTVGGLNDGATDAVAVADGASDAGAASGPEAGGPCTTQAECPTSGYFACLFPVEAGCSATGHCFAEQGDASTCANFAPVATPACGCNGKNTVIPQCTPTVYAFAPIAYEGMCIVPASDAGGDGAGDAQPADAGADVMSSD